MGVHRLGADAEALGCAGVGVTAPDRLQDRQFAITQLDAGTRCLQQLRSTLADGCVARANLLHDVQDFELGIVFETHAMYAGLDQFLYGCGGCCAGQQDESCFWRPAARFQKNFEPVCARHIVVKDRAIWFILSDFYNCGDPVCDGTDNFDVIQGGQRLRYPPRDEHMIVSKNDCLLHRKLPATLVWVVFCAFCMVAALPLSPTVAAERPVLALKGPSAMKLLGQHLEYTTDSAWQMTISDFVGQSAAPMQPLPGSVPDFGYTSARIWLRVPVVNATSNVREWRFFVHANFTQSLAIWKVGSNNAVTPLLDLNTDSPFSARPVNHPQMVAPFELAPGEAATLVIAYYSQGSSRLSMSIETPESLATLTSFSQAKSYAFYGMMLVMILLASVGLVTLRQPVFAAYVGYLCSVLAYVAHADGAAFQYVWSNFPRFNSMASVVAGSGVMVFGGLFAMALLRTARFHPVMHRVLLGQITLVIGLDIVLWLTNPQLLKRILVYMILVSVLTFVTASLVAARSRFREVRFFVLAWFAALIPASLFTARYAFGLESETVPVYDAVRLALVCDALLMGLAVFDFYNQQRQASAAEALAHAKRNLALAQRLALLEESYEQVATTARQREEGVKDTVHDLRQPMHALRLSLRQMFAVQPDKPNDIGQIESALSYMERLVNERLADQPQGGKHVLDQSDAAGPEPGFHDVLRGVCDMFDAEAVDKGLELRLVLAAPDAKVAAYPLMRVLSNLVSNAIKYTQTGRVVVAVRREGNGRRIEVHDTGPGLSGADFTNALLRNQRLGRDLDAADGSGLGLAVVQEIADANNWRLSACADRKTGASIRVAIPGPAPD